MSMLDKLEMCLCSICEKAVFEEDVNEEGQCEDCVDETNPYMEKRNVQKKNTNASRNQGSPVI
jgi:hypothetical protein